MQFPCFGAYISLSPKSELGDIPTNHSFCGFAVLPATVFLASVSASKAPFSVELPISRAERLSACSRYFLWWACPSSHPKLSQLSKSWSSHYQPLWWGEQWHSDMHHWIRGSHDILHYSPHLDKFFKWQILHFWHSFLEFLSPALWNNSSESSWVHYVRIPSLVLQNSGVSVQTENHSEQPVSFSINCALSRKLVFLLDFFAWFQKKKSFYWGQVLKYICLHALALGMSAIVDTWEGGRSSLDDS